MLSSPQIVTIDGTAHSLSRINQDNFGSVFIKKAAQLEIQMTIRHTKQGKDGVGQMERHNVELKKTTWDANGVPSVFTAYTVLISPRSADPDVTNKVALGLNTWVTANVAGIGSGEN